MTISNIIILICDNCKNDFEREKHAVYPGLKFCGNPCRIQYQSNNSKQIVASKNIIRNKVLLRDGNRCKKCGTQKERLNIHHIDGSGDWVNWENSNNNIENLITYCTPCHNKEHTKITKIKMKKEFKKERVKR